MNFHWKQDLETPGFPVKIHFLLSPTHLKRAYSSGRMYKNWGAINFFVGIGNVSSYSCLDSGNPPEIHDLMPAFFSLELKLDLLTMAPQEDVEVFSPVERSNPSSEVDISLATITPSMNLFAYLLISCMIREFFLLDVILLFKQKQIRVIKWQYQVSICCRGSSWIDYTCIRCLYVIQKYSCTFLRCSSVTFKTKKFWRHANVAHE